LTFRLLYFSSPALSKINIYKTKR